MPPFGRRFFASGAAAISAIGTGSLGGKAQGLVERTRRSGPAGRPPLAPLAVDVPTAAVLATDVFDAFVERNGLREVVDEEPGDRELAAAFQRADLPAEVVGDLWEVVRQVRQPLAVRSSSLLEDALGHPLAGVYGTKMIPGNQPDAESRFRLLLDAVKFVYASTFFHEARAYRGARPPRFRREDGGHRAGGGGPAPRRASTRTSRRSRGRTTSTRWPADRQRAWWTSPSASARRSWTASAPGRSRPRRPGAVRRSGRCATPAPDADGVLGVNMGPPPPYDPMAETEYLVRTSR